MHLNNGVHAEIVTGGAHAHVVPVVIVPEAHANSERRDRAEKQSRMHSLYLFCAPDDNVRERSAKGRRRRAPRGSPPCGVVEVQGCLEGHVAGRDVYQGTRPSCGAM